MRDVSADVARGHDHPGVSVHGARVLVPVHLVEGRGVGEEAAALLGVAEAPEIATFCVYYTLSRLTLELCVYIYLQSS